MSRKTGVEWRDKTHMRTSGMILSWHRKHTVLRADLRRSAKPAKEQARLRKHLNRLEVDIAKAKASGSHRLAKLENDKFIKVLRLSALLHGDAEYLLGS